MLETLTKLDNLSKTVRASARIVLHRHSRGWQRRDREQKSFCLSNAVHGHNINLPVCVCVSVTLSVNSPTGERPQRIFLQ